MAKARRPYFVLVLLTSLAAVMGLSGVILAVARPNQWLLLALIGVGAAILTTLHAIRDKAETLSTNEPSTHEFLLAGIGSVAIWASVGLHAWLIYSIAFVVVWILGFPASWIGFQVQAWADPVALGASLLLAILPFAVDACRLSLAHMNEQLFPNAAGVQSAFYEQPEQEQRSWRVRAVVVTLVAVAGVLALIWTPSGLFSMILRFGLYTTLQFAVFIIAWQAYAASALPAPPDPDTLEAVRKLAEAVGYHTVPQIMTGDPAIDPLLVYLDLVAFSDPKTFHDEPSLAIDIRTKPVPTNIALTSSLTFRLPFRSKTPYNFTYSLGRQSKAAVGNGNANVEIESTVNFSWPTREKGKAPALEKEQETEADKETETETTPAEIDYDAVSGLHRAAWICGSDPKVQMKLRLPASEVEPRLVLVGVELSEKARALSEQLNFEVTRLSSERIREILATESITSLQGMAVQDLRLFGATLNQG